MSLCISVTRTAEPLDRKQTIDPLDQCDCVVVWNCRASTGSPPSNLTGALTGHCVARRRRTCKEWNRTGEGNVWSQLAFHTVSPKTSEASPLSARSMFTGVKLQGLHLIPLDMPRNDLNFLNIQGVLCIRNWFLGVFMYSPLGSRPKLVFKKTCWQVVKTPL
jgi:hypothetical protein